VGTILRTEKLNRHFGGVRAVNDATITVEERTVKAVIGPNGAGKTTLFNVVTGRLQATSGKVFFQEEDITNQPVHELVRRGICRTFQINSLFLGLKVFENVRIARQARLGQSHKIFSRRESLTEVNDSTLHILEQVALQDKGQELASTLSYGDQRSLEVAIALAGEPKILLLDEPTAGMSQGETDRIIRLIEKLVEQITIVLVEHDVEMVLSISDSISVLHQGAVIAEGSPDDIRKNSLVREAYLGEEEDHENTGA
jgi:branched-chain amino acid transport system ATP-binding protein